MTKTIRVCSIHIQKDGQVKLVRGKKDIKEKKTES